MIACDGLNCPVPWFHFRYVGLKRAPKYNKNGTVTNANDGHIITQVIYSRKCNEDLEYVHVECYLEQCGTLHFINK